MLVIDTFNVLHVHGVLPPEVDLHAPADLAWLLGQSRYAGTSRGLVCDGPMQGTGHAGPATTRIGACRVIYTGAGREADDELARIIEASSFPTRLIVVSSDRRVIKAARQRRAGSVKSDAFLRQLAGDLDRQRAEPMPKWVHEIPLDRASIEHWLETFGMDEGQAHGLGGKGGEAPRSGPPPKDTSPEDDTNAASRDIAGPLEPKKRPIDDETRRLAEEQGLDPDDLDMERWLGGG